MVVSGGAVSPENRSNEEADALRAERDKAREECGHQRAMRQAVSDEFGRYVRGALAEREAAAEVLRERDNAVERLALARSALVDSGYFTEDQVSDDIAPRIVELGAALAASPTPTGPDECPGRTCDYGSADHCKTVGGCLRKRVGPATPEPTEETPWSSDSWRTVAYALAARVKNFDQCDNGHGDWREGVVVDCPCCRDRAAYAAFVKKVGSDPFGVSYDGPRINLLDIPRGPGGADPKETRE